MTKPGRCLYCNRKLATPGQGTPRLFCDDRCRMRAKRIEWAAERARLRELDAKK